MKKISYYLIFIVIVGGVLISFWVWQKYFKEEKPTLLLFNVRRGDIQEVIKARGEVVASKEFDLSFPFSGIVEKIFVKEGDEVKKGKPLIKLETKDFELEIQSLEAILEQNQSNLNKLIKGATEEDIKISETKVMNSEKALEDAEINLENVNNKATADLENVYSAALSAAQAAVSAGKSALLTLTDIQFLHFMGNDQDSMALAEKKSAAVNALLGASGAGKMTSDDLSILTGGAFGIVEETVKNATHENIDRSLSSTLNALRKTKIALESVPVTTALSSAQKTDISTEKSNITSHITTISTKQQSIEVQKVTNTNSISAAQTKVNDAKSALELARKELDFKKAGARSEDVDIAKAKIKEIESQIASLREKIRKSTLYSPDDVKIIKIWLERQELFESGQTAISLFTSGYKIQSDVSELDISKIHDIDGNDVAVYLDAFPDNEFKGKVMFIEPKEIIKEGDKYYRVNIFLENQEKEIRSGMSADLIINISSRENVLKIPELAVYDRDGKKFTTIMEGDLPKEVEIEIGISDGENVEVIRGLSEGQTVAVAAE